MVIKMCHPTQVNSCDWTACYDDESFVRAVVDYVDDNYCLDRDSVHLTGISNGGMFSYYAASRPVVKDKKRALRLFEKVATLYRREKKSPNTCDVAITHVIFPKLWHTRSKRWRFYLGDFICDFFSSLGLPHPHIQAERRGV